MSEANLSALLWEGFRIDAYGVKASDQIHIRLVPDPAAFHDGLGGGAMNCSGQAILDSSLSDSSVSAGVLPSRYW